MKKYEHQFLIIFEWNVLWDLIPVFIKSNDKILKKEDFIDGCLNTFNKEQKKKNWYVSSYCCFEL